MHKQSVTRVAAVVLLVAVGALSASARARACRQRRDRVERDRDDRGCWTAAARRAAEPGDGARCRLRRSTRSTAAISLIWSRLLRMPRIRKRRRWRPRPSACSSASRTSQVCSRRSSRPSSRSTTSLAGVADGAAKTGGIAVGEAAARAMLVERTGDGRGGPFTPSSKARIPESGGLRRRRVRPESSLVTRPPGSETCGPSSSRTSRCSARTARTRFRAPRTRRTSTRSRSSAPHEYEADRGPDHSCDLLAGQRPDLEPRLPCARDERGADIVESARLFAMTNMAAADGSIGCWNDKYYWSFWRPITAIREAASDGNPATVADPNWKCRFSTRPFRFPGRRSSRLASPITPRGTPASAERPCTR